MSWTKEISSVGVLLTVEPRRSYKVWLRAKRVLLQADIEEVSGCPPLFELRNAASDSDLERVISAVVPLIEGTSRSAPETRWELPHATCFALMTRHVQGCLLCRALGVASHCLQQCLLQI